MISDNGTQLTAANEELKKVVAYWDWDELASFGATKGMDWKFLPTHAPWRTGPQRLLHCEVCEEAITLVVGESVMTFSELQTLCYEAANLVNESW